MELRDDATVNIHGELSSAKRTIPTKGIVNGEAEQAPKVAC